MAEQFLSRLQDIEKSISALGETLKRMVTILATMDEIRSDIRFTKEEILDAIRKRPASESGGNLDHVADLVKGQFDQIGAFIGQDLEAMKQDLLTAMQDIQASTPPVAAAPAVPAAPAPTPTPEPVVPTPEPEVPAPEIVVTPAPAQPVTVTIPADKAMKVADELDNVLASLKMGCKAGDVLNQIEDSKAEILKFVESDPVLIQLDKWKGIVAAYPKRKELQARDILKLKKGLRAEIPKYRPA